MYVADIDYSGWAEEPAINQEFVHLALSPNETRLYAWTQANGELDHLYFWEIHTVPSLALSDGRVSSFDPVSAQSCRCAEYMS